jgi:hypothetical protein
VAIFRPSNRDTPTDFNALEGDYVDMGPPLVFSQW